MTTARRRAANYAALYVMLLPAFAYFVVFHYTPMAGLILAFKDYRIADGVVGSPWAGLDNFRALFASPDFPRALGNTITISLLRLLFGFVAPIALAIALNELRIEWFKRSVQTLTYIPHFLSWVILGGIFLLVFAQRGPVNAALGVLGVAPQDFLTNPTWFIVVLIATGVWQSTGYAAVIYLAALAGIPPSLYEAARIDGASRLQQIIHVTLPGLLPTIIVLFILNLAHILDGGFDQIYNLYNPLVYEVSDIIDTFILRKLQMMEFSQAAAAGMFKSAVALTLVIVANTVVRRMTRGEQGVF